MLQIFVQVRLTLALFTLTHPAIQLPTLHRDMYSQKPGQPQQPQAKCTITAEHTSLFMHPVAS